MNSLKLSPEIFDPLKHKIACVVVTFNRKQLLKECIESLILQTQKIDQIFVIDNASTDGTDELFTTSFQNHKQITYTKLNTNTGGAGGFHSGVKLSFEKGFDWVWLMDDDVEAYPNALENLLKYSDQSLCIHGQRTNPNGGVYLWEAHFNSTIGFAMPYADVGHKNSDSCKVNVGCFEGMLIHRSVIEKIGFPDPRFFIAWDDTIYGYLASKYTDVLYVKHLSLKRKRTLKAIQFGFRTLNEVSDLYRFYHIRNRKLVREYLKNESQFSNLLFNLMTGVLFVKEYLRAVFIQGDFKAHKSLIKGLQAGI